MHDIAAYVYTLLLLVRKKNAFIRDLFLRELYSLPALLSGLLRAALFNMRLTEKSMFAISRLCVQGLFSLYFKF